LFDWIEAHDRVKMALYYRDVTTTNAYNLQFYPGAQEVLRNRLDGPRWVEFAPGSRQVPDPPPNPTPGVPVLAPVSRAAFTANSSALESFPRGSREEQETR
jgi:hypothetical protein